MNPAQTSHVQEGAENILDHAKPTEPVNLTSFFWKVCKAFWLPTLVVLVLVTSVLESCSPKNLPTEPVPAVAVAEPEPVQTAETPSQPQITPKKIARQATNTPASGAYLPVSDDVLGDFIAELERKKTNPSPKKPKNKEPAPSASNLEQDFEYRLFNFERKIP